MRWLRGGSGVLAALMIGAPVAAQGPVALEAEDPAVIEVRMVDVGPTRFVFEPADITVRPGDRVVWIQTGVMPHNVEFTRGPTGSYDVEALPTSPFLTLKEQRWELVIDDRFDPGRYHYICTPHASMGMRGTMEVVSSGGSDAGVGEVEPRGISGSG